MAANKQQRNAPDESLLSVGARDWIQQFLRQFELDFANESNRLPSDADISAYRVATTRAFKATLLESGMDSPGVLELFAQVATENQARETPHWDAELNRRRCELIDRDIQGSLSSIEQLELANLTQQMRKHVDTEVNFPTEGAKQLHRYLLDLESSENDP